MWNAGLKNILYIDNTYIVLPYIKISNEVGRIDNFRALARKLSFLPSELEIFDIRQHYVCILFIFQHLTCWNLLFVTPTNMNLAVSGIGLAVEMTSWIMLTASSNVTFTLRKCIHVLKISMLYQKKYISWVILHGYLRSWKINNVIYWHRQNETLQYCM